MARPRLPKALNVFLNDRAVGTLTKARSGAIDFRYEASWLEWKHTFAVSLSLPLREQPYTGDRVIAVFDNLLPDSDQIRRRLAERTQANGHDPYSLLTIIGRDCVGALQFLPEGGEYPSSNAIDAVPISDVDIARKLTNLASAPLGLDSDHDFRISLAGAQEKTALLKIDGDWFVPHGSTATTHILKPQIGQRAGLNLTRSIENEYFCMQVLKALELPVAETCIDEFAGERALVIERFDRRWTKDDRLIRLPQEDCCQALSIPAAIKDESDGGPGLLSVIALLKGSDAPLDDQQFFMSAQFSFWLLGATDGHAKNFSLALYPGGGFRLTPLYDVMSTQPLRVSGELRRNQMRLAMAVGDNRHYRVHEIQARHFIQSATSAGMAKQSIVHVMIEISSRIAAALDTVLEMLPNDFPADIADAINEGARHRADMTLHALAEKV
jgi:serine/threonine-protein kinase HipA